MADGYPDTNDDEDMVASTLGKRAHSTVGDEDNSVNNESASEAEEVKAAKTNAQKGRGPRGKRSDYATDIQTMIKVASDLYEVFIICRNPFPDPRQENEWATEAWGEACVILDYAGEAKDLKIHKMVRGISYKRQLLISVL